MSAPAGDDERTSPLGLYNTGRSYWRSAEYLVVAHLDVTHRGAPITFLFCHAIELYLKAFLRASGRNLAALKQSGHRVAGLAKNALAAGLDIPPDCADLLGHIENEDVAIEARYIVTGFKQMPTYEAFSTTAETLDRAVGVALAAAGHPVRHETFTRPSAPPPDANLKADTVRVLVHLFGTINQAGRNVGAIATALNLQRSVLEYHLDRLAEANLAEFDDFNSMLGHVCWALTAEGRRYVVERGLA